MKINDKFKPVFERVIPKVLRGDFSENADLVEALTNYTWTYSRLKKILDSNIVFLDNLISESKKTDSAMIGTLTHAITLAY